jgi:hypothetical protein
MCRWSKKISKIYPDFSEHLNLNLYSQNQRGHEAQIFITCSAVGGSFYPREDSCFTNLEVHPHEFKVFVHAAHISMEEHKKRLCRKISMEVKHRCMKECFLFTKREAANSKGLNEGKIHTII